MRTGRTLALLGVLLAHAAAQDEPAAKPPPDARVIRCVLDRHPRSLVVPLGDGLWAAWDTSNCTLEKVWLGDVSWDGPVYTTVHGPQPTSRGEDLHDPLTGARWVMVANGTETPLSPSFEGYATDSKSFVEITWNPRIPGWDRVRVHEHIVRETDVGGRIHVERQFTVLPEPAPSLALVADGLPQVVQEHDVTTKGTYRVTEDAAPPEAATGSASPTVSTRLTLNGVVTRVSVVFAPPPTKSPPVAEPSVPSSPPAAPAESPTDLRTALLAPPHDLADPSPTQPGLALRIWALDDWSERIEPLERGQTPNVDLVLRTLDLESAEFKALGAPEDRFLAQATATLALETAGAYAFRVTSDDGSRLAIDGRELIDNDGLHSEQGEEATLELAAGPHELEAWMFEAAGGEVFRLQWKPPGAPDFALLPLERLSVPAGVVRVTSPGPKRTIKPLPRGRPGDGQWLAGVHPSFELHQARPEDWQPKVGGLALRGETLLVSTWDRDGAVWALDGARGDDPERIQPRRIASGLAEPLGLLCDGERSFVLQKQELTELIDRDGDGVTDFYRCACNGWAVTPNFHEFAFGLAQRDEWIYATLAVAIDPGGRSSMRQAEGRGAVIRIHPDDGRFELVAQGLRTPNGVGFGSDLSWKPGDPPGARPLYVADNQGDWLPSSKLVLVQDGAFYGNRSVLREKAEGLRDTPPVVWLPQGEIGNSPSQPAPLPVGPWKGQMLVGDVTYGGLQRVAIDPFVNSQNACVFAFTQGLEAGVNRLCWATDGADAHGVGTDLFVGGIGSTGNWGQDGKLKYGLQRLRYTGAPSFEMLDVRVRPSGLRVEFTEPLAAGAGLDPDGWFVESWRYEPTDSYGGPKIDQHEHRVTAVQLDEGRRSLLLAVAELLPGTVVHVRALDGLRSDGGRELWTREGWLTVNVLPPGNDMWADSSLPATGLTEAQRAAGWRALFDGSSLAGWHDHAAPGADGRFAPVAGWAAQDGTLVRAAGGDLVSDEVFGDFELELDWRLAPGGNSGIFFLVDETPRPDGSLPYTWESGIEMQVLDDAGHRDGQNPLTSAGSCYALYAPTRDDTRPIGHWNHVRLVKKGAHVEHWLNGQLQCAYEIGSEGWKARVAQSKFASMPAFGKAARGRIALQDHGDEVAFRNVLVRTER